MFDAQVSLSPSQFHPDLVSSLKSVLNAAVDKMDAAHRTPATKAKMAERLLRLAANGVTDRQYLMVTEAVEDGRTPAD